MYFIFITFFEEIDTLHVVLVTETCESDWDNKRKPKVTYHIVHTLGPPHACVNIHSWVERNGICTLVLTKSNKACQHHWQLNTPLFVFPNLLLLFTGYRFHFFFFKITVLWKLIHCPIFNFVRVSHMSRT